MALPSHRKNSGKFIIAYGKFEQFTLKCKQIYQIWLYGKNGFVEKLFESGLQLT